MAVGNGEEVEGARLAASEVGKQFAGRLCFITTVSQLELMCSIYICQLSSMEFTPINLCCV